MQLASEWTLSIRVPAGAAGHAGDAYLQCKVQRRHELPSVGIIADDNKSVRRHHDNPDGRCNDSRLWHQHHAHRNIGLERDAGTGDRTSGFVHVQQQPHHGNGHLHSIRRRLRECRGEGDSDHGSSILRILRSQLRRRFQLRTKRSACECDRKHSGLQSDVELFRNVDHGWQLRNGHD